LSIDDKKELPLHAKLNYPEWLDPYLKNAFNEQNKFDPEQFENEILALNGKACVDIRINTLKSNKEDVKKLLQESGFRFEDTPYSQNGIRILGKRIGRSHEIISDGLAEIQDEGSQLVAEVCNVSPTDTVIDFCAGAGGKTLAISASMSNKGRIFALDRDVKRLEKAKLRFRRANVNNVYCQEITSKWIKRHTGCADVVLVDAPCSGTGTWRRNPDMRAKFSQNDLDELIALQAEILSRASNLVKIGGKLVYATCSILKEENEYQIDKFLAKNINFVIKKINLEKTGLINANYLRLSTFRHGTDGFFSVCLEKKC
jgi:16S rRNA (cytosine967-C5)-methyltransferase